MKTLTLQEAQHCLPELICLVGEGEEVFIGIRQGFQQYSLL